MTIFNVLSLIGGISLFLFGMNVMGQALERRAGAGLRGLLGKLTTNRFAGFMTGLGVTAIIQSSAATTVMVVGFVNSGLMSLHQSIGVIMGANVGTTVTAWMLSLSGIQGESIAVQMLNPKNFSAVLALIGVILYVFMKNDKRKSEGLILLGFATLMFGMNAMTDAVSPLQDVEWFRNLFIMFENPLLGVLFGALVTAAIQSSSASVGMLQALSATGAVTIGTAVPIIMGQNIGTCVTAMISSVGTNKNARRASLIHLAFNVIGTTVWLIVFTIIRYAVKPLILSSSANQFNIAIIHSMFNIACTILMLPMGKLLEKIAVKFIPDAKQKEKTTLLDERLLKTPALALSASRKIAVEMATVSVNSIYKALDVVREYSADKCKEIREDEDKTDYYEDVLGTYLLKLSATQSSNADSKEAGKLLNIIGDCERIADHSINIVESAEELHEKGIVFSDVAKADFENIAKAVSETLELALRAFVDNDLQSAFNIDPLEEVVDILKENYRKGHIERMQQGKCTIEAGFVWSDLLTNLERISDHCSNIAGAVLDNENMNYHQYVKDEEAGEEFKSKFNSYCEKYLVSEA
ncbi:MAG: Na/Pi cotransporter family protein [Clostridia bacterium]|nr:Na/Pi cotransporter family protein [Clostridia bacterium]